MTDIERKEAIDYFFSNLIDDKELYGYEYVDIKDITLFDIPTIIHEMKTRGILTFTVSMRCSAAITVIAEFMRHGAKVVGCTKLCSLTVDSRKVYEEWNLHTGFAWVTDALILSVTVEEEH